MHELGGFSPNLSLQSTVAFLALTLLIIIILALQASELRLNLCELGPMLIRVNCDRQEPSRGSTTGTTRLRPEMDFLVQRNSITMFGQGPGP